MHIYNVYAYEVSRVISTTALYKVDSLFHVVACYKVVDSNYVYNVLVLN